MILTEETEENQLARAFLIIVILIIKGPILFQEKVINLTPL